MLSGNCLCGSVAYEVDADPGTIVHRTCRTCRKTHGSAFSTVTSVPRDRFRWVRGEDLLKGFESSRGKVRYFCSQCGSHIVAARRQELDPASDGLSRYADRRATENAHLAIGCSAVVRSRRSITGVAGRHAAEGMIQLDLVDFCSIVG